MNKRGFTLIELLVVIGIIGMLVAIAIPNFLSARQRANDSRKKEEMAQLKNALRMYYNDHQQYPSGTTGGNGNGTGFTFFGCGTDGTSTCPCSSGSIDFAAGGVAGCDNVYMKHFPTGFMSASTTMKYYQTGNSISGTPDGSDFCLQTTLDNLSDPDIATSQSRCDTACKSVTGATYCKGLTGRYCVCAD